MELCDIGVNLTNNRFNDDWQDTVHRANQAGVTKLIITGTDIQESRAALEMSEQLPEHCYATVGIHPHYAKDAENAYQGNTYQESLLELARHPKAVAIGECGLDFNRNFSPPEVQKQVFSAQLDIAAATQKPVFLHERDAFDTQLAMLSDYRHKLSGGVVHCFTGNIEQILAYLDLDFYIGITGWLCDPKRGKNLRDAVQHLPLNRLLLETDAPYLMPKTLSSGSKRNEPENLPHILEQLADILPNEYSAADIAKASYQNSVALFGFE